MRAALTRRDVRDLWRMAAREAETEQERVQARETAKLWDGGLIRNWKGEVIGRGFWEL